MRYLILNNSVVASLIMGAWLPLCAQGLNAAEVETIVVQGSKNGIGLGRFDGAVLIKTAEELNKASVTQVQDLEKVFPGLLIRTRGNRTYASGTVRGISSPDYYSPAIQVYVDGVPQDSAFLTQELLNVDSVELLRGPQGTLYGASAQGGIINIVTRKGEERAEVSVTYAEQETAMSLLASRALSGSMAADISLRGLNEKGQISHAPTNVNEADEADTLTGAARLHYMPSNSPLSLSFSVAADQLRSHEEWYLTQEEFDAKETSQAVPVLERDVMTYALSGEYAFEDSLLTSVLSLQQRDIYKEFTGGIQDENQDTAHLELRLNTNYRNGVSTVVGFNVRDAEFVRDDQGFPGFYSASENRVKKESQAVFGEANIPLTNVLDLTLGLRIGKEKSNIDYGGRSSDAEMFQISSFANTSSETLTSPKAALGWQLNPLHRAYISYTRGYRPNGFNNAVGAPGDQQPFDSERSDNMEIGWRCDCAEGLLFDAALYSIHLHDTQLYVGNVGSQVIRNSGEVESEGLELSASYVTDNLNLNIGATVGRSYFTEGLDPVTNTDISDNDVPYAPDTTIVAGLSYTFTRVGKGDLSFSVHSNFSDDTFFNESNTLSEDAYWLTNFSIEYQLKHLNIAAFGKNIDDVEYVSYRFQQGENVLSNYGRGRIFGVKITAEI